MSKRILFIGVDSEKAEKFNKMKIYERRDIGYIAGMLKAKGYNVMVYSKDIRDVDFNILNGFNPDIICLADASNDQKIIEWAKNKKPEALIGRNTGNCFPDCETVKLCMEHEKYIDFMPIGGEVYNIWVDIVGSLAAGRGLNNVQGIIYRQDNELKINGNVPDFDINSLKVSDCESNEIVYITTSLGCIGNCSFCIEKALHKKWKGRSIDSVIEEIEYLADAGIHQFQFTDAELEAPDVKLNRLNQLCEGIIGLNRFIMYRANFRPDFSRKATPEIMELLINSGLYRAYIGVESGCQEDLNIFNKKCTVQEARATVQLFESYGVHTEIGFIMFQPFSTLESLSQNIDMLEDLGKADFDSISSYYRDQSNCKLHEKIIDAGLERSYTYAFMDKSVAELFRFINFYINEYIKTAVCRYNEEISYYSWRYYHFNYYRRIGKNEQCGAVQFYMNKVWIIQQSMSVNLCNWFRSLLDITRSGFNIEEAIRVSIGILNEGFINETASYIEREHEKLTNILEELDK